MVDSDRVGGSISLLALQLEGDARGKRLESHDGDLVRGRDLVIVLGVSKGEGEETLLLQVGLMDAGKRLDDDGSSSKVARLQGSMLSAASLSVVLVPNDHPRQGLLLVVPGHVRDLSLRSSEEVLDAVDLAIVAVDGTDEHVVGDVVKVTTVLEPLASGRDVVGGALALDLDKDGAVPNVVTRPGLERAEELEAGALGVPLKQKRETLA